MNEALAYGPLVVLALAFVAYTVTDAVRHETNGPKWLWIVVCLASVPLGGILYLLIGRAPAKVTEQSSMEGPAPVAPEPTVARPRRPPPDPAVAAVATTGLTKVYDGRPAVDGIDLHVPQGSVYGLVGPNGAGKTTLLQLIAGMRTPTAGHVEAIGGRLAVLPDTPTFDPWLTATEVVDLARVLVDPAIPAEATAHALHTVGLGDAADRRNGGFSRGMLQRLGLAATIVGDPDVLLLDEPCSALDPLGRREVLDLIARLGGERTVLFCSHILGDVQEVCDTVGVLRAGRLLYQGPLMDLLVGRAAPAYTVRLRAPLGDVADRLAAEPWVTSVEQTGAEELRVAASSVADAEAGLVPALARSEARVVSIVPVAGDLEHVFLELLAGAS